jgi:hypothetical protein
MTAPPSKRPRSGRVMHTVRTADRRFKELKLTRKLAMAAMCTECLGWEHDPKRCTSYHCPLFPFRAATRATRRGNLDQPKK